MFVVPVPPHDDPCNQRGKMFSAFSSRVCNNVYPHEDRCNESKQLASALECLSFPHIHMIAHVIEVDKWLLSFLPVFVVPVHSLDDQCNQCEQMASAFFSSVFLTCSSTR